MSGPAKPDDLSGHETDAELEATIDDIFEDVRDFVSAVPDTARKQELAALVDVKKETFYRLYDDSRYQHNGQDAYSLLGDFIDTIKEFLRPDDNQSRAVAAFLRQFCKDMYDMWGTRAFPGETHFGRIQERMVRYYKTCPNSLRIAKIRRERLAHQIATLKGWRQELQDALDGNTVDYHKTWISLVGPEERMEVTQIYRKVDKNVLCCIIPWDVASRRSGNSRIYCMRNQCIMLWPDRSVDVYNSMDMTYVDHIGSVGGAFNDVWGELWTCYVMRWEPTPDVSSPAREDDRPPAFVPTPASPGREDDVPDVRNGTLTKEEVREKLPSARLDAKLIEIRTLLSALGRLAA